MTSLLRLPALVTSVALAWVATPSGAEARPSPSAALALPPSAAPSISWKEVAPGFDKGFPSAGDFRLEMYRFDLERYGAEVVVTARQRPRHARIWLSGARHTAAEVLRELGDAGVVAAVNGGFFDEGGRSLGLRISHGDVVIPLRPNVDWGVLCVAARRARIVHSRDFIAAPGIDAAIQVGPRILIDGVVPGLKPQVARRTAVALDVSGRFLTLVVVPEPVAAAALGARLASLGFRSALLLDGGPSTQLAAAGSVEIPGGYAVPDLLAIVRR